MESPMRIALLLVFVVAASAVLAGDPVEPRLGKYTIK